MTSPGKRNFRRARQQTSARKKDREQLFSALMGLTINGEEVVSVPERDGFVWVRLRNAQNEVIQAFNETTSQVYNLPIVVKWDDKSPNRYTVVSRDTGRYGDWGTDSSYLPQHGLQHSFGQGSDITWVYGSQFMPLNAVPSGTSGGPNVIVHPYTYFFNDDWVYAGGTGTSNLLGSKPAGATSARMVLVYLDVTTGNLAQIEGSEFDAGITGSSQITDYLPALGNPLTQIPIAGVRLVTGTSRIGWDNIYDLKPYYATQASGTAGGGGGGSGQLYISGDDTTLGYGESKIVAGAGITLTVLNPGGNEQLEIRGGTGSLSFLSLIDTPGSYVGNALLGMRVNAGQTAIEFTDFPIGPTGTVKVSANDGTDRFLEDKLQAGPNITLTTVNEGGDEKVQIESSGGGGGGGAAFAGARSYLVSGTAIPQNSWTDVQFHRPLGEINFDTNDFFQSGTTPNADIDIPESGYYHVYGQVLLESPPTGAYYQIALWKGSVQIAADIDGFYANGGLNRTLRVVSDDYLLSSETVRLRVFTNLSGGVNLITGTANTFLGIHEISPPSSFEGARVYRTSNATIASGTPTAIEFQTEEYDVGDYYSAAQDTRFTVPNTGYYHLVGSVGWEQNNEDDRLLYFRKNGTAQLALDIDEPISNNTHHMRVVTDALLSANDYVELIVVNNRPGNTTIRASGGDALGAETFMTIHLLGS
jgi:hypothetical protein